LLCQDWPGPFSWGDRPIPPAFYYAADDLAEKARVQGLVAFLYNTFSVGTPGPADRSLLPQETPGAPRAFLGRLAQRLLAHPNGGALAVIGPVDRAWGFSFHWPGAEAQLDALGKTFRRILGGVPVGHALEFVTQRYAALASELNAELEETKYGKPPDALRLASLWVGQHDARSLVLAGDPAVRLAVPAT